MYDHIGLKVGRTRRQRALLYRSAGALGYVLCSRDDSGAGFGPTGRAGAVALSSTKVPGSGRAFAFRAPDHAAISNSMPRALKPAAATMAARVRAPITTEAMPTANDTDVSRNSSRAPMP